MSEYELSPTVIKEATSYVPFKNVPVDAENMDFEEDAYFEGANLRPMKDGQTIAEVKLRVAESSANGNAGISFRTDIWLTDDICAGRVRPADADERDWKTTKAGLRTLTNLAGALGQSNPNPIAALTAIPAPTGLVHVKIRVYRANNGMLKWELNRVSKVKV